MDWLDYQSLPTWAQILEMIVYWGTLAAIVLYVRSR